MSSSKGEKGNEPACSDAAVVSLVHELEELCGAWLAPHIDALRKGAYRPRPKVINDTLWGSIRLLPWEVAILDS
ncbi:MAG: hypothetical protein WBY94_10045, partial [Polyangiaceae bacterium]